MSLRRAASCAFAVLALAIPAAQAQPLAFRVADLNTTQSTELAPRDIYFDSKDAKEVNGLFYFVMDDGIHGQELWASDGSPAGTRLVADLCPGACSSGPRHLTASPTRDLLLFAANDGVRGRALWETQGTPESTRLVFNSFPYRDDYDGIGPFFEQAGNTFFSYFEPGPGGRGRELIAWTGGSTPSSFFITDINPSGNSNPRVLAASGGAALIVATDGVHGMEPWILEGPPFSQARPLGDLRPGSESSIESGYEIGAQDAVAVPGGGFVFMANDGIHGSELWKTDGTPEGTFLLKDLWPGAAGSLSPRPLTELGGFIYFAAFEPQNGTELWRTDGTTAGTVLVKDINPGTGSSGPFDFTVWGNRLFFYAGEAAHGDELWVTDGTAAGTVLVKDVNPGPSGSIFSSSTAFWFRTGLSLVGDRLLFFANGPAGIRLWKSDGTTAGTLPVDLPPQAPLPNSASLQAGLDTTGVANGYFFFKGNPPGEEIWRSDGTAAGTILLKDTWEVTSSLFVKDGALDTGFATLGNSPFFQATDGLSGVEIWKSNGTMGGTVQVSDLSRPNQSFSEFPRRLSTVGNRIVFVASDVNTAGLWSTDGTSGNTQSLPVDRAPDEIGVAGGNAFFANDNFSGDFELWKTDGTPAGTGLLEDLFPESYSVPHKFVTLGSRVFFVARDSAGNEIWASDGTAPGTYRVADISQSSEPIHLTAAGNLLFFSASTAEHGYELWKTDGTEAGTVMVKDVFPGDEGSISFLDTGIFAATANGLVFFTADDGQHGEELWKSDGTAAGTVLVKDIRPDSAAFGPRNLTALGNRVYFTAFTDSQGEELWVSDGTEAGTHLVEDVLAGPGSSRPRDLTVLDARTLLFSAFDGQGVEPWRSGGTAVNTRRLADVAPGTLSSSPMGFLAVGSNLYFAANDNTTGFELWALPKAIAGATFEDVPTTYWAWPYVESLADAGLTIGCGDNLYCPARPVTRAETAVFLLRGLHGPTYVPPPATGTRFDDAPVSYWASPWIEQLATEGLTNGCSTVPPLFCPESNTARDQMAVLILRATHGPSYTPPPPTGTRFTDVPASYWAAAWIEQLAAEGITTGCTPTTYCPGDSVSRDQMAAFLTRAFHLTLP